MHPLAVIDVETTGLNPFLNDRVVEVAAVLFTPGQGIQAELTTLVNPERDVGPTSIHGLTPSDLVNAPRFSDIAGPLAQVLRGTVVLVGHNVRYDVAFLRSEYQRLGVSLPSYATWDTMVLARGGTLCACCARHGVTYGGNPHTALGDARATVHLLQKLLPRNPRLLSDCAASLPPEWPPFHAPCGCLLSREAVRAAPARPPSYLQRLAQRLSRDGEGTGEPEGEMAYRALLSRALEDGRIDETEGNALVDMADRWGLALDRVTAIHRSYLSQLVKAAHADRRVTDAEQREIEAVVHMLGLGPFTQEQLHALSQESDGKAAIDAAASPIDDWAGKTVCFTGECCCSIRGEIITREKAEKLAARKGLRVMPTVTKALEILVVADPHTQSNKARKARQYGTRIVHERLFWRTIGVTVD